MPRYMLTVAILVGFYCLGFLLSSIKINQIGHSLDWGPPATTMSSPAPLNQRDTRLNDASSLTLPNIPLRTQDGREVRFYDDLVKNKSVIINFMYTRCGGICPVATLSLAKVHRLLGNRVGRDIQILSISLDPDEDTPEALKHYAEAWGNKKGWTYLTGSVQDVTLLRLRMGLYDPDASLDSEKISHTGIVSFGNDNTGRWAALPVMLDSQELAEAILRTTRPKANLSVVSQKLGKNDAAASLR